jgi:hypothetical protein
VGKVEMRKAKKLEWRERKVSGGAAQKWLSDIIV